MRILATVFAVAALGASAFDVDAWNAMRALHVNEAVRLRAAYSNCVASLQGPAEDVTSPVDTEPDGSVRGVVNAKRVPFCLDTGMVWAENVVAKKFGDQIWKIFFQFSICFIFIV